MQSAIYGFFAKYIKKLGEIFPHSILGKVFFAVCSFVEQTVSGSVIGRFYKKKSDGEGIAKESIFVKIYTLILLLSHYFTYPI